MDLVNGMVIPSFIRRDVSIKNVLILEQTPIPDKVPNQNNTGEACE